MSSPEQHSLPPRRVGGAATAFAILAIVCITGFGIWLRLEGGYPTGIDTWWYGIAGVPVGSFGLVIATSLHGIGSAFGVSACIAIAAAALIAAKRWRDAAGVVTAGAIGVTGSESLKLFVGRVRPPGALVVETGFSYPSGHSMGAAALATALALLVITAEQRSRAAARWAAVGAVTWILLMMWSRTALQVHWITDTVAGALLGVSAAILARGIWQPRPPRSVEAATGSG